MKAYKENDITQEMIDIATKARDMWVELANKWKQETAHKDNGFNHTFGHGFYINIIPKGKRKPRIHVFIEGYYPDAVPGHETYAPVLKYLRENGIECDYTFGRLD